MKISKSATRHGVSAAAIVMGIGLALGAQAQEASEIIVTGTRTSGLKAVDSPAPITVLGVDILKKTGQPDLIQALSQNVPSFNAQAFGGDTANLTLSAKLRGLSPNHALILINGKRRHGTSNLAVLGGAYQGAASADLNFIPLASVERVEVLLEGAAAQYGTDAIAGVINIIQKKSSSGGELILSGGQYIDGDGTTSDLTGNIGFAPFEKAYLNLTFESKYHDFSFRGDTDPRTLNTPYNATVSGKLANYPALANAASYPYMNRIAGDAEYYLNTVAFNSGYEISPEMKLYAFGTYGKKKASAFENYRVPNLITGKDGTVPFPLGFSPREGIDETDLALSVGVEGMFGGWSYDLSSTYGKDEMDISVLDSFNRSLYIDTSTTTTKGYSPTNFHAGSFAGSQWSTTFDLTHEFDVGMATPLTFATGVEYRKETYEIGAGDAASRYKEGSQSYPGFSLTDAGSHSRDNKAIYFDAAVSPVSALQVDAAVRYEKFSDFGDTTVAKLTSRYDFSPAFAIRGTVSTGFRAPTLAESYYSATNVSPTSAFVQLAPNSAAAKLVGVNGLKPEKSKNYSVGFVTHLIPKLTITVDAYQIDIDDRIVGSGSLYGSGGAVNSPAVTAAIIANGNSLDPTVTQTGINIFTNGLDTRSKGVDIVATYSTDFDAWGKVNWSLTGNVSDTKVTRIAPSPSQLAANVSLFDKTAISNLETTAPKYRAVLAANWMLGSWAVSPKISAYGESSQLQSRTGAVYYETKLAPAAIFDLDVSYRFNAKVKLNVGANNLFNYYPDKINGSLRQEYLVANSNAYVTQYPTFSPYGINGGYYYAKLAYSF